MKKINIVIVHSFSTNSNILSGLYGFLNEKMNVYPIDLPGFEPNQPALQSFSLKNYIDHVEKKIAEFQLDNYVLAGISFGFLIISYLKLDSRCKAILAIEPYTGIKSLNVTNFWKLQTTVLLNVIIGLHLSSLLWKNAVGKFLLAKLLFTGHSKALINTIFSQIDGETFFQTAKLLLQSKDCGSFDQKKPYILLVNPNDTRVKSNFLKDFFRNSAKNLLIINTAVDHYPSTLNKKYFIKHIPEDAIAQIAAFIQSDPVPSNLAISIEDRVC